jgi:hypothetical protein
MFCGPRSSCAHRLFRLLSGSKPIPADEIQAMANRESDQARDDEASDCADDCVSTR